MRNRLLTYVTYSNRFCGVEHTTKNGQDHINVTTLKQSKKELLVDGYIEGDTIDGIAPKLPKHQSIFLVLNNEKVLTKTIESNQKNSLKLVYKAFPNINLDEFYYEVLSQTNTHFIALCRKHDVESIINNYAELKISVLNFSMGNTLVGSLTGFLNQNQIYSSNSKIDIENEKIVQIEKTNMVSQSYNVNGLEISSAYVLSFSGALQTLIANSKSESNFTLRTKALYDDFKQSRFFNLFLKAGGLFILGLLLINFFFFNHYFNKVSDLRQLSEVNQSTKDQILQLDETVSKKQKMVDDLLKSNGSKSAFYSNHIVHSLPKSVLLNALNYQPLSKRIKADKAIELKENSIVVEGRSSDSEAFSNWIVELERRNWVTSATTVEYAAATSRRSEFKIEIVLKDD